MESSFQTVFQKPKANPELESPPEAEPAFPTGDCETLSEAEQALFAEAFRQGLYAGLPSQKAFLLAISVHPNARLSQTESEVKSLLDAGCDLDQSLSRTGAWFSGELLATLEIGERRGCLQNLLEVLASGLVSHPGRELAKALRRPQATTRFSAALATLLKGTYFRNEMLEEAGRIAGGGEAFVQAIAVLKENVEIGSSLSQSMALSPAVFDRFYCRLLKNQEDPTKVQPILAMLGNPS